MRIARLTLWRLDLPLAEPYWLSGGRLRFDRLDSTLLRLETDDGREGWAEACPWGASYLPAHGAGVRAAFDVLGPAVLGADPLAFDDLERRMDAALPGHLHAKAPIDIAAWDLFGHVTDLPLWRLFGAATPAPVNINSSIATGSPEEMVARIARARAAGYGVHSAKIGGADPATDIARIEAIEAARAPGEAVTYDVNRAWTPAVAVEVLNSVSARGWVEQPCETLSQCADVAARVPQPIMLDESLLSFDDHLTAARLKAGLGAKVKPNRLGGLTRARRVRDLCLSLGWPMHIEEVGGTALADTAALHLAASTPDAGRLASWLCHPHLDAAGAPDLIPDQGARNRNGVVRLGDRPGLGVAIDADQLDRPFATYEEARP